MVLKCVGERQLLIGASPKEIKYLVFVFKTDTTSEVDLYFFYKKEMKRFYTTKYINRPRTLLYDFIIDVNKYDNGLIEVVYKYNEGLVPPAYIHTAFDHIFFESYINAKIGLRLVDLLLQENAL
jgi:hypothetical protein